MSEKESTAGEAKLREWAEKHIDKVNWEEDLMEAGRELIRQCAELIEVCECGDYNHQHENGTGKCRVCGNS